MRCSLMESEKISLKRERKINKMNVHVFKTDISSASLVNSIMPLFNSNPNITQWSVDIEDIDNVLRVFSNKEIEQEIIRMVEGNGFKCNPLQD